MAARENHVPDLAIKTSMLKFELFLIVNERTGKFNYLHSNVLSRTLKTLSTTTNMKTVVFSGAMAMMTTF